MDRSTLIKFISSWHDDVALSAPQVGKIFGISRGNARYYLNQLVDEGILIRIQHEHNVVFVLSMHKESFKRYLSIGVTIN